jgi:hypothetical protein
MIICITLIMTVQIVMITTIILVMVTKLNMIIEYIAHSVSLCNMKLLEMSVSTAAEKIRSDINLK